MCSEAVQIHHITGNHWVTSLSIGGEVAVYDSLYHGTVGSSLAHQLALLYRSHADNIDDDYHGEADKYVCTYHQFSNKRGG